MDANEGARLQICPGTYTTTGVLINKDVTMIGAGSGKGGTVLSARGEDRVLRFNNADVDVRHLAITGGAVENSGAGIAGSQSDITLEDVLVTGNHAGYEGGGIYAHTCTMTLVDSRVEGNSADNGGGIFMFGTLVLTAGSVVTENTATGGTDRAGGIANLGSGTVEINGESRVSGNTPVECTGTDAC